jgi:sugar phosphate isomerase/epimerase
MHDALGPGTILGYCTNVHAGATWAETRTALETHACAVREQVCPDQPMGVGLWLSAAALRDLDDPRARTDIRRWLENRHLDVFTINGFPYHNFHEAVVKHRVYQPTWAERERLDFTIRLAELLAELIPPGAHASISTLPIAWPRAAHDPAADALVIARAAEQFAILAQHLAELRERTGRRIHVDIEPEPGCVLDHSTDVVRFFQDALAPIISDDLRAAHLGVCHDICHAAIMGEAQADAIDRYADAGIRVGKVQVSSALRAHVYTDADRASLRAFAEPRYLHQTMVRRDDGSHALFTDLDDAIDRAPAGTWTIHFHMPLHIYALDVNSTSVELTTTQDDVRAALFACADHPDIEHFEIETYAWSVLPEKYRPDSLAAGIADEWNWLLAARRDGSGEQES